ncbi:hypothetical protein QBC39DRAFT_343720 [Podospora conica]|nr:hypothetical protein QBC39DRAFT_343720 [Schizothecium conicum]
MNPSSRDQPPRSHVGPRTTGGMASKVSTPATPGHGQTLANDNKKEAAAMATQPKMMDAEGAVGRQFTTSGAIGGTAQAIGGPLAEDGVIGRQFTEHGAIGGAVQKGLGGGKEVR